ncbi:DUF1905 domain-containing protein [Humidisolicoccus flavus]|uniref:DUF1905 domain-containing protein n=1 Tax=Humidisolicoccus flavus TaxID=3111414 RepID=UPI00324DDF0A
METIEIGQCDFTFTAVIETLDKGPDWNVVVLPDSKEIFGTGKSLKVAGTIDGAAFSSAFLPTGQGAHLLSVPAKIRKSIGKGLGDEVTVHLTQRLT